VTFPPFFQKPKTRLNIPGSRRVTRSKFHTEDPQTLGAAIKKNSRSVRACGHLTVNKSDTKTVGLYSTVHAFPQRCAAYSPCNVLYNSICACLWTCIMLELEPNKFREQFTCASLVWWILNKPYPAIIHTSRRHISSHETLSADRPTADVVHTAQYDGSNLISITSQQNNTFSKHETK